LLQRCTPISTVHCAFTAAIIFLTDAATITGKAQESALRNLKTCVEALEEMETAWSWSTRSLLALWNISQGWHVETTAFDKPRYRQLLSGFGPNCGASDFESFLADTIPTNHCQDLLFNWTTNNPFDSNTLVTMDMNDADFGLDAFSSFHGLY
jgi:hypothetical protein